VSGLEFARDDSGVGENVAVSACELVAVHPPLHLVAHGDFAAQRRILLKLRIHTNSTMENPKMNTLFIGNVLYLSTVSGKSANISQKSSHVKLFKMGFKMLLRACRLLIRGLEGEFAPLVVHWSTKKCKITKNWSASKMHFLYTKMILWVSSFQ